MAPLEHASESPKISNACGAKAFRKIYYTKGKPLKIESFLHQTATFPTVKPTAFAARRGPPALPPLGCERGGLGYA